MVYVRTKTVSGREYRYLVAGEWVNGKTKQRVVKYMGAVNPVYQKMWRKSNAWLFARDLTSEEQKVLKQAKRSENAFCRDRTRIILLSASGKSCKEIAEKLDCDARKVRGAVKAFNDKGLKCLERGKSKGARLKFTKEQRTKILELTATEPRKLGLHFTSWSLPKLRKYLIEQKIVDSICIESIRKILNKQGTKLKRSKRWQYSNDPNFSKKSFA